MKIVFWGNGDRSTYCLNALLKETQWDIPLVVSHPLHGNLKNNTFIELVQKNSLTLFSPEDPNSIDSENTLKKIDADLFILAGYGKILKETIIKIPRLMAINLHGGRLPERRGSSPMNWALILGDSEFGISIIKLTPGVDTGPVLAQKILVITQNEVISDLHQKANAAFPELLVETIKKIETNNISIIPQENQSASYFPLRSPQDGFILWDQLTAEEIHNRIRALSHPYAGAYSYYQGKKIVFWGSQITETSHYGEPGKIYKIYQNGNFLVCARDKCLLVTRSEFSNSADQVSKTINRYDRLSTMREAAEIILSTSRSDL